VEERVFKEKYGSNFRGEIYSQKKRKKESKRAFWMVGKGGPIVFTQKYIRRVVTFKLFSSHTLRSVGRGDWSWLGFRYFFALALATLWATTLQLRFTNLPS
jgi:hypothetical protein